MVAGSASTARNEWRATLIADNVYQPSLAGEQIRYQALILALFQLTRNRRGAHRRSYSPTRDSSSVEISSFWGVSTRGHFRYQGLIVLKPTHWARNIRDTHLLLTMRGGSGSVLRALWISDSRRRGSVYLFATKLYRCSKPSCGSISVVVAWRKLFTEGQENMSFSVSN